MKLTYCVERTFTDTSSWNKPRTLRNLPEYLNQFGRKGTNQNELSSAPESSGSPHTLVVTAAGLRAAETARYMLKEY